MRDDELLCRMNDHMRHRGPDGEGVFVTDEVSLGHRRLAIIDLATGGQPIYNEDRSVVVVFNGEIYNYPTLRRNLEARGHRFATATDTEVIVHTYEQYGLDCVKSFNGEFAFALWDKKTRTLVLARDRLGIRPLFYCRWGSRLAFASELRSLLCWKQARGPLSTKALGAYLTLRYVPRAGTMFDGVEQLPPGSYFVFQEGKSRTVRYWHARAAKLAPRSTKDWVEGFRDLFIDSVRLRMRSDVPIGAYLSSGIDSASIVTVMRQLTSLPIQTFTIGGFGAGVDESAEAHALAQYLGAEHHALTIESGQFELLPQVMASMNRPIGDAIILPTWLLAKATASRVKVVLSGEGADEILAGYVHHLALSTGQTIQRVTPDALLRLGRWMLGKCSDKFLNCFFPYPAALGKKGKQKLINFLDMLVRHDVGQQYLQLACVFREQDKRLLLAQGSYEASIADTFVLDLLHNALVEGESFFDSLIACDLENWLADYTLAKQDALSMDHSLEARVPFLDHRLVEYALALPTHMRWRGLQSKVILRRAMRQSLPRKTASVKKKAFYIPFEKCFNKKFDCFVQDVLLSRRCLNRGIFNQSYIERYTSRVRSCELIENKQIMSLLLLELWLREYSDF